jgi:hypothetical protein
MSKDLADGKEGEVALEGEGGMKKAKLCLAFFIVDRDPACGGVNSIEPTKGFSILAPREQYPILIRMWRLRRHAPLPTVRSR